jgi:hypothetical protein
MNDNKMELMNLGQYYMHYNMDDNKIVWEATGKSRGVRMLITFCHESVVPLSSFSSVHDSHAYGPPI